VIKSPVNMPGVIAVWHLRVDKDGAHRWLRACLLQIAKLP